MPDIRSSFQQDTKPDSYLSDVAKQFSDQSSLNEDYYQHTGGDVYMNASNSLVISFHVEALTLKISNPPCPGFSFLSPYSCPVKRNFDEYPLLLLLGISKSESLTIQEISEKGYKSFEQSSFSIGYCD